MQQPWGLSGPQFLGVYSVAFVVAVLLVVVPRFVINRRADGDLTPYQAAFLLGGTERVLVTGVFELLASGHTHRSRDGRLTRERGFHSRDPLQEAIARNMAVSANRSDRVAKLRRSPAIEDLKTELRASGLLMTRAGRWWWSVALLLPITVWLIGLVRVVNGALLHRPVADLIILLVVSAVVLLVLGHLVLRPGMWATSKGAVLVGRLRDQHEQAAHESRGRGGTDRQLTGVALLGVAVAGAGVRNLVGAAGHGSDWQGMGGGGYGTGGGCGGGGSGGGGGCGG